MATVIRPYNHGVTETFYEIYPDFDSFKDDYEDLGYPTTTLTETNLHTLYNLLYAKYGLDEICNVTQEQFKYRLFGTIFQYGPAWEARLDIQGKVKTLLGNETELLKGSKAIHNHAYNPATAPSTQDITELTYINDQNTTNYQKAKMDAYGEIWNLIVTDVTEQFLDKFKPLFKTFVNPFGYGYVNEGENNE